MLISANNVFDAFEKVVNQMKADLDLANSKAESNLPKPMEIGAYPSYSKYFIEINNNTIYLNNSTNWFNYYAYYGQWVPLNDTKSLDDRKQKLLSLVDKMESDIKTLEADCAAAIENNKEIHKKIKMLMEHIGVVSHYTTYEYKTPKSRTKTSVGHTAGYISDLNRNIPIAISGIKPDTKNLRNKIEELYNKQKNMILEKERDKALKEKIAKDSHELALLRAKYTPNDAMADKDEILSAIIGKDKYLRLAYYLEQNRNDWTDGCEYAKIGLIDFVPETDTDNAIVEEIQDIIDNWHLHLDGRVFRDFQYNYGYIYNLVEDESLLEDFAKINSLIEE